MPGQETYHFGVPAVAVWISHILIGVLLIYISYLIIEHKSIDKWLGILLFVIGLFGALYHIHIWYVERNE
jgi:hypothetical protein